MIRTRVLLADDHKMLVDALKRVLEPHYEVVGSVNDGRSLLESAAALLPDVVVVDIAMPKLNGLDAVRHLKKTMPAVKAVFMTMYEDPDLVGEAFRAGASAFLLKQGAALELTDAIEQVLKGRSYITPRAKNGVTQISLHASKSGKIASEPTPRQREVIQLLAEGLSMKEVANELNVTLRTVAGHKYAVMEHLQLKNNAALVQYAIKRGIISINQFCGSVSSTHGPLPHLKAC
jgi:DNA-binding NarL/FixJ family response regulator